MGLGATWSTRRCPCTWQKDGTRFLRSLLTQTILRSYLASICSRRFRTENRVGLDQREEKHTLSVAYCNWVARKEGSQIVAVGSNKTAFPRRIKGTNRAVEALDKSHWCVRRAFADPDSRQMEQLLQRKTSCIIAKLVENQPSCVQTKFCLSTNQILQQQKPVQHHDNS